VLIDPVVGQARAPGLFAAGTSVRVRNTLGSWAGGFEVVSITPAGYLVRRLSDGWLLPTPISAQEIRQA
jgi:hypothetical protein